MSQAFARVLQDLKDLLAHDKHVDIRSAEPHPALNVILGNLLELTRCSWHIANTMVLMFVSLDLSRSAFAWCSARRAILLGVLWRR